MHFWIDKRSQGCGFSGRHLLVPPSLSGSRRSERLLCNQYHSKVMVTPVHRFQSIESVATNGLRHPRTPSYHTRTPINYHPAGHYIGSTSNVRNPNVARSLELITTNNSHTQIPRTVNTPTARLKCGVWAFFAIVTFFLAGAKYYFHGVNMGMEALAFCSLLVVILIIGGLVSLYEALTSSTITNNVDHSNTVQNSSDQLLQETNEDFQNHVPSSVVPPSSAELPPPPYHIAIMLPTQQEHHHSIQIIRDSPPPSYDKAVT